MCVFSHICNVSVFLTFHEFVPFFSLTMPVLLFMFVVLSGSGLSDLWPPVYADHSCPFYVRCPVRLWSFRSMTSWSCLCWPFLSFLLCVSCSFSVRFSVLSILCPVYCVLYLPFLLFGLGSVHFLFVVLSGSCIFFLISPVYADHSCPFSLRFVLFSVRFSVLSILCPVYCVLYLPFLLVPIFSLTIPVLLFLFAVLSGPCLSCPYFSGCSVLAKYSALSSTLSQLYCEVPCAPIVSYLVLVDIINLFLPILLFRPVFYPTNGTFFLN